MIPPLLSTITQGGGSPEFFFDSSVSQLSALAIHRPIWGRVAQDAFELSLPQITLNCDELQGTTVYSLSCQRQQLFKTFSLVLAKYIATMRYSVPYLVGIFFLSKGIGYAKIQIANLYYVEKIKI